MICHQKGRITLESKKNTLAELGITNIVNYLRRSRQDEEREKKTGEDTLHEQKQLMNRVLSEYGIPYEQKFEVGSGDKISTRPVFQQVIKDLENEKYDAIAVKEISRMGRGSFADMGVIYDLIVEKRIRIITPWKIYDPSNPADLRQIRFEMFMSREEFETTRERLNGGRYSAALEGKWVSGAAPFGYDYNQETKRLMINDEEAEVVRTIFDFYANGIVTENGERKLVQFQALSSYLKRIGIKTIRGKNQWAVTSLRYLLTNDTYTGTLRYNTTYETSDGKKYPRPNDEHVIVENAHPAIIDMKTWDKVQYRINNRDTNTRTRLDFEPNRLAGLCVCKKCGKKFIRRGDIRKYKKKDGTVSIYDKSMLFCGTTGCTYVRYHAIEEDILETLKWLSVLDNDTLEKSVKKLVVKDKPKNAALDLIKYIESKRTELTRRMNFIYDKYESGIYTDEMFLDRKAEIDKEFEELNKVKVDESNVSKEQVFDVDKLRKNINSILEAYQSADSEKLKNDLLHTIFSHIYVEVLKKGSGRRPAVHRIEPYLKARFLVE